jgi:hypothetical protein
MATLAASSLFNEPSKLTAIFSLSPSDGDRAASSSASSPCEARAGRGLRRGETNKNVPPLPNPLLHPMEEKGEIKELDAALGRGEGWGEGNF